MGELGLGLEGCSTPNGHTRAVHSSEIGSFRRPHAETLCPPAGFQKTKEKMRQRVRVYRVDFIALFFWLRVSFETSMAWIKWCRRRGSPRAADESLWSWLIGVVPEDLCGSSSGRLPVCDDVLITGRLIHKPGLQTFFFDVFLLYRSLVLIRHVHVLLESLQRNHTGRSQGLREVYSTLIFEARPNTVFDK